MKFTDQDVDEFKARNREQNDFVKNVQYMSFEKFKEFLINKRKFGRKRGRIR